MNSTLAQRLKLTAGLILATTCSLPAQAWIADYDQPSTTFNALFSTRVAQGYRAVYANARRSPAGDRFEVIWQQNTSGIGWYSYFGMTPSQYQSRLTQLASQGFRVLTVDSYGTYPNEKYIAIFIKDSATWITRSRLSSSSFQTEFTTQHAAGYRLVHSGCSGSGSNIRYEGVWVKPQAGYSAAHNRSLSNFISTIASQKASNARLISVAASDAASGLRMAGVWDYPSKTTAEEIGQTLVELRNSTASYMQQGYRPNAVVGYETSNGPRYISSWTLDSNSKLVWRASGIAVSGMSSFDQEMKSYMQARGISQGSIAVTRGSKLVYSRGFTWAPSGTPKTQPDSLFRIASLSKSLTAVGIMRLAQQGRITLDQKVSTILDMSQWIDSRAQNITIRHLLQHWGGFDRTVTRDPMFNDLAISATLNRPLPTTPQMVIDFVRTRPLDFTPGTKMVYSNFGYCLLGRVIEQVAGTPYEDFMQREVFLPIGASSIRVTDSLRGQQIPGEVEYNEAGNGVSVMGAGSPPTVPWPYGAWNIRTMDSHGGFVSSAADLARFLTAFDNKNASPLLSRSMIDEMWKRPPGVPSTTPVFYGAGWSVRENSNGSINTWHTGSLNGTWTIMVRRSDGLNWVALFNKRSATSGAIDGRLHVAANAVSNWPAHDLFQSSSSLQSFGRDCSGIKDLPYLRLKAGNLPKVGSLLSLELTSLGSPTALPFILLGFSNQVWAGGLLPASLANIGMGTCNLNLRPDISLSVSNTGGKAVLNLALPNQSSMAGTELMFQGFVTAPGANALGLLSTQGAALTIGAK